jgi:hypothetical protein
MNPNMEQNKKITERCRATWNSICEFFCARLISFLAAFKPLYTIIIYGQYYRQRNANQATY